MGLRGSETDTQGRQLRFLALAGLALAIFVRAFALADKPFWQDEAWLVLLARQPLADVVARQSPVPLGFALAVKAASFLPGPPEVTLRLLPLLAGVAAVVVLPLLARALGADPRTQVVALWIAAGAPALVNYSRELKHYGLDALLGAAFALLAIRLFDGLPGGADPIGGRGGTGLSWLAAAVPWFSFAAVFPVSAVLVWGWCTRWRTASGDARRRWVTASAAFLVSFVTAYVLFIRHQSASPRLRLFWGRFLHELDQLPVPLGFAKAAGLVVVRSAQVLFPWIWPAALGLAALGLFFWPRAGRHFLLWWTSATALLAAAAGVSGRYVISGRLLLFTAPLLILPVAFGLVEAGRRLRVPRALPLGVALLFSGFWSYQAVEHRLQPGGKAAFLFDHQPRLEAMITTVESRRGSGEPVYVTQRLAPPFGVYARGRLPDATLEPRPPRGVRPSEHVAPLSQWVGTVGERGWILLSPKDRKRVQGVLREAGRRFHSDAVERGVLLWRVTPDGRGAALGERAAREGN